MENLTEAENKIYVELLMGHLMTRGEIEAELGKEGAEEFLRKNPLFVIGKKWTQA